MIIIMFSLKMPKVTHYHNVNITQINRGVTHVYAPCEEIS
jgi:hypothetical protein